MFTMVIGNSTPLSLQPPSAIAHCAPAQIANITTLKRLCNVHLG